MSQKEPIREPCPHCGELAALGGRICPHCKGSLLVDLILPEAVRDPRTRYHLARALSQLGPPAIPLLTLQKQLASPQPIILKRTTRLQAASAREILEQSGITGTLAPSATERPPLKVSPLHAAVVGGLAAVAGIGLWVFFSASEGPAPSSSETREPRGVQETLSTEEIARLVQPSIVSLTCRQSVGSGFFISGDRLLTNAHVLCPEGDTILVHFSDQRELTGEVLAQDEDLDLALISVPGAGAEPLAVGDAALLNAGEEVIMIGTPLGMDQTVHEGIVSHAARNLFGIAYIQVDANVNPGNSGGPLLNRRGNVVGIISLAVEGASGLGFAIPINYAFSDGLDYVATPEMDVSRWREVLRTVQEAEQRDIAEVEQAFNQAGVVQAAITGDVFLVFILKRSPFQPSPGEEFPFSVVKEGLTACGGMMRISSWAPFDDAPEATSALPEIQWLRKQGLTRDLYWGAAYFDEESCTRALPLEGAEFVLDGGDPDYDQTTLVAR
ncbi:MAG: S1C family serine protease [Vicinamibacteria bacterium]